MCDFLQCVIFDVFVLFISIGIQEMKYLDQHLHKTVFKVLLMILEHLVCIRSLYFVITLKVLICVVIFFMFFFICVLVNETLVSGKSEDDKLDSVVDSKGDGMSMIVNFGQILKCVIFVFCIFTVLF